eukprot:scaffold178714_cov18-Tisochrysis_lutea.AAC.1
MPLASPLLHACVSRTHQTHLLCRLQLYSLALALSPGQPGTFAALGYTQQLMGHLPEAIEAYHSALAIRPDDSFTVDMLNAALEEYSRADL